MDEIKSKYSKEEIERRRSESISALKERDRQAFDDEYQKTCDAFYWKNGPCCAGCDHWNSSRGLLGNCTASPIVSSEDVLRSLFGARSSCTLKVEPNHPYTDHSYSCGMFKDDFDWSSLDQEYLLSIGAKI